MSKLTNLSKSPQRNTFQKSVYEERLANPDPKIAASAKKMIDFYEQWDIVDNEREMTEEWCKNNLEYDLRTTEWIIEKARASEKYAQHIYAALCNNDFIKRDMFQVLKEETWGCSWRHAGGVVADMLGQGDYIDWYCSGMGDGLGNGDEKGWKGFVQEGYVTEEIEEDFKRLGWNVWKEKTDE